MLLTRYKLERLAAAAAARLRRARRRANELKTRTIQRMQLQMTTPLDIGLEQQDLSLAGQNDTFVLEDNQHSSHIDDDALDSGIDDVDPSDRQDHDDDAMEVQLEEMYENYQGYLREKDAKFRVKEARRQNGEEEWTGIGREASDDDDDDESGWDKREESKYEESHSSSDEDDENRPTMTRKRHYCDIAEEHKKRPRLDLPPSTISSGSKTANAWFSQGMFAGLEDTEDTPDTPSPVLLSKIEKTVGEEVIY
jgi:AdoMet-dependent rRNA methyltransferase SPB1